MLSNFKLLCFVSLNKIEELLNMIKEKYNNTFPNFINYFEKYYLKKKLFNNKCWNYNKLINNDIDIEKKFFTNNFVESCNRTLNMHYVGGTKTFLHFEKAINDIIEIYKNNSEYKSPKISITRSLNYYSIKNMDINLITNKDITNIINDYKIYCESNNEANKIDEKLEEDDDNLLEIYNNNKYLNEQVINSDCDSSNSDESDHDILIESHCLERKDSSDDDDNENLNGKFNLNNKNLDNNTENQLKTYNNNNNNNPDKNHKKKILMIVIMICCFIN